MPTNLEMSHNEIVEVLDLTKDFFHLPGDRQREVIVKPMLELSERLQHIDGYMGLLGVGYPFYGDDPETGDILPIPSVIDYLDECKQKTLESAAQHGHAWPCAECQVVNRLPNLTDQCMPCERVSFKPRDVFRALPDLDILTVFRESTREIEENVEATLIDMGWVRFNTDIKGAFDNAVGVLTGDKSLKLPIDFHMLTYSQLVGALQKIAADTLGPQVGIKGRSWRATWKDQPVDISFSFIFSMTEIGHIDPALGSDLSDTRTAIAKMHSIEELIAVVDRSKRCGAVIGSLSLRDLLRHRLQTWTQ